MTDRTFAEPGSPKHVAEIGTSRAPAIAGAFEIRMTLPFRNVRTRRGLLLEGPAGWGEWSPFPEYEPALAARWWRAAVEAATQPWPAPRRDEVPINAVVPAVDAERAHRIVRGSGCTTAKVKVGVGDDRARVEAVRDALGPHGRLRLDVNATWDVDTAIRRLRELARYDLEYVEQPVADLAGFARLRSKVDMPLAADESVRLAPDPLHIPGIDAADIVILKVQPLGGVRRCLEVAEAAGRPVVVSSAIETSVGLAAGLALAAALPELAGACGLGTMSLLAGDVTAEPLQPVDGRMRVRRPVPDRDLIDRWVADGDQTAALYRRLDAVQALPPESAPSLVP